jgi:hypothetical protein
MVDTVDLSIDCQFMLRWMTLYLSATILTSSSRKRAPSSLARWSELSESMPNGFSTTSRLMLFAEYVFFFKPFATGMKTDGGRAETWQIKLG